MCLANGEDYNFKKYILLSSGYICKDLIEVRELVICRLWFLRRGNFILVRVYLIFIRISEEVGSVVIIG